MKRVLPIIACMAVCCFFYSCASIIPGWIQSETYGKGSLDSGASFFLRKVQIERSIDGESLERELGALLPLELGRIGFTEARNEKNADYCVEIYGYEREYFQGYAGKRSIKLEIKFYLPGQDQSFLSAHAWSDGSGNLLETGVLRNLVLSLVKCVADKTTGKKS